MEELPPFDTEIPGTIVKKKIKFIFTYIYNINISLQNDIQPDFYGRKLAVATSLGTIYVFKNTETSLQLVTQINAHEGPILKVDFSHPKFGSLLGSAGFDGKTCLWKENNDGSYENAYEYKNEEKAESMNYITFSKNNNELMFATGGVYGNIVIHRYKNDHFSQETIFAHEFGVNSISFNQSDENEFVSCGNDSLIKIWMFNKEESKWENTASLEEADCVVNDVAFKNVPNEQCFASCSEDGVVMLFWKDGQNWKNKNVSSFEKSVSQLSWNENASTLTAVLSDGELKIIEQDNLSLDNNNQ